MKKTHSMITIGILAVLLGSMAVGLAFSADELGFLSVNNKNPDYVNLAEANLNETNIEDLLQTIPEIQEFLSQFEEVELYLWFDGEYEVWYAFYFVIDDYMSYAFVVIDDTNAEILTVETVIASEDTNLTETEVLNIALSNDVVQEFITAHPDYGVYVYYDYFQTWFVDFYDEYYYSWCSVVIDDLTGDVIEVFSSEDLYDTNLSVDEVVDIALTDLDVQQFIADNPDYEMYVYLTEFYDTFGTDPVEPFPVYEGLTWIVGFYSLDFMDWIEVSIDDETGEIIDKWMTTPATKTESEIYSIANSTVEVEEFLALYDDVIWDLWYDGFGTWYVWIWSEVQWDAYVFIEIDDLTGDILYIEQYLPIPPVHEESEVLAVILSLPEVIDFMNNYPDYQMWIYFFDGFWYVDVYSEALEGGLWIIVDDSDLSVFEIESYVFDFPVEPPLI
ncbi:MAG: hypothetical protein GPJ51_06915 [Candidatus Heimdallarchaeota archaeon]|nr:hypothetical protein [Candidatus Heimdallarchaeota archaeon]